MKPTFVLTPPEAQKDPVVQGLCVRQTQWHYYPRIMYDISLTQYSLGLLWSVTQSESTQEQLRQDIGRIVAPKTPNNVVCALSLRTFFDALLRTLKLPAGSEIIWSGLSIPQMFQIAEYHHLRARAFDIDLPTFKPDLEAAERCFNEKTKLMVLAPVFGRPMRFMKELIAMARARNVMVMMDCAQCWCIRDELLAFEPDIISFSFGSIKYSTAINGSISIVRNDELCAKVKMAEKELTTRSFGKHAETMAKNGVIMLADDPVSFGILRVVLEAAGGHIGELTNAMSRGFPGDELIKQIRHRPRAANLRLLRRRLTHYDRAGQRLRTISGWDFLSRLPNYIQVASGGDPDEPERSTFWLFPMIAREPRVVSDALQSQGFDAALGTSQMRATGDAASTPQCFNLMQHVLYIPVYPEMSEESRDRFINTLHRIPRKYVESPSNRFHEYVARRPTKHAYQSPAVTALLKNRPKFHDPSSSLLMALALPAVGPLVCMAKL